MQAPSPQNGSLQLKKTNIVTESLLKTLAQNISVVKTKNSILNTKPSEVVAPSA
jgi:hypothetical protein